MTDKNKICKKCNNQGYTTTLYRDGHEDIHICDCEYNVFKKLKAKELECEELKKKLNELSEVYLIHKANKSFYEEIKQLRQTNAQQTERIKKLEEGLKIIDLMNCETCKCKNNSFCTDKYCLSRAIEVAHQALKENE